MMHEYPPQEQQPQFEYPQAYPPQEQQPQAGYMHQYPPQEQQPQAEHIEAYSPANNLSSVSYSPRELFAAPLPHSDMRFVATLTYSLGWLSGLLFTVFARENRYVRFHALQSLLFFGGINVLDIAFVFLMRSLAYFSDFFFMPLSFLRFLFVLAFLLLNLIAFVGWLIAIFQAYKGSYYRLPVVGDFVARHFAVEAPLK